MTFLAKAACRNPFQKLQAGLAPGMFSAQRAIPIYQPMARHTAHYARDGVPSPRSLQNSDNRIPRSISGFII